MAKQISRCESCIFAGQCVMQGVCDDYDPTIDERQDALIEKLIDEARQDYYDAWIEYIADF